MAGDTVEGNFHCLVYATRASSSNTHSKLDLDNFCWRRVQQAPTESLKLDTAKKYGSHSVW